MSADAFAATFAELRRARGFTYAEVSEATGLSRTQLCNLEKGRNKPSFETAAAIAQAFGVSLDDLASLEAFQPCPNCAGRGFVSQNKQAEEL